MSVRHLVLCFDGTWNDPSEKTNVWELFRRLDGDMVDVPDQDAIRHHKLIRGLSLDAIYMEGVGANGQRQGVLGGALGLGLHDRVVDVYVLASRLWRPGTMIWVFGFSRGAWAARSLAGFLCTAGLMSAESAMGKNFVAEAEARWLAFKHVGGSHLGEAERGFWDHVGVPQPIRLVGVWDTVGALGIPFFNGFRSVDRLERQAFDFADLDLSPRVQHGCHALSIDETRFDFMPTLWHPREGVVQQWFPGVHADVGGGYPQRGLADVTLTWMLDQVRILSSGDPALLKADPLTDLQPDPLADRHDEAGKLVWKLRPRQVRKIPDDAQALHTSVTERLKARHDWRPAALSRIGCLSGWFDSAVEEQGLIQGGEVIVTSAELPVRGSPRSVTVQSRKWWNVTSVRVRKGQRFHLTATGSWNDSEQTCGADGYSSNSWALKVAELVHARRVTEANWFQLIAAIHADDDLEARNAEAGNFAADVLHVVLSHVLACDRDSQLICLGTDAGFEADRDGTLYLFANDNSAFYGNNSGAISVSIERLS